MFRKADIRPIIKTATSGSGFFVNGKTMINHSKLSESESAIESFTQNQAWFITIAVLVFLGLIWLNWQWTLIGLIAVLTIFYFLDLLFGVFLAVRSFSRNPEISISDEQALSIPDADLPVYTVFCPLYKEWQVLPQFIEAMENLSYPKEKLQVMLQLEEDDRETVQQARSMNLPLNFEIVVVPDSKPKTKPKAMNYGLQFARGTYITIYDAEDVPDPLQLRKAIVAFRLLPKNTACVQGKLNFYNPNQNLLTRLFATEYSLWFDLVLPGLQSINAPIPLGGTSNHFVASILREVGGWDAFNVTEDCDLGLRLAVHGYRTAIVDSTTLEEANSQIHNWYRQRSRWIKGYMQTFLVHMRNPLQTAKKLGWRNFFLMQLTIGGKVISMFVNPLLWLVTIIYFAFRSFAAPYLEPLFPSVILYLGVVCLIFGNFFYIYAYLIGLAKRQEFGLMKYAFLAPIYWLGMSVAAWKGLYELIVKPHYWQKTVHGLHLNPENQINTETSQDFNLADELAKQPDYLPTPPPAIQAEANLASVLAGAVGEAQGVTRSKKLMPTLSAWITLGKKQLQNNKVISGGAWLVIAMFIANFLNFLTSAILSRKLSLSDFGTLSFFTTVLSLFGLVLSALSQAVTHKVAFLDGQKKHRSAISFGNKLSVVTLVTATLGVLLWLVFIPELSSLFQVSNKLVWIAFSPTLLFAGLTAVQGGYLKGRLSFKALAIVAASEAVAKLGFSLLLIYSGYSALVSASLPLSVGVSMLFASWYVLKDTNKHKEVVGSSQDTDFPTKFFGASLISGVATVMFMSMDVILAKHYLTAELAGAYALLALSGKTIYLAGSMLNYFTNALVSKHEGEGSSPRKAFAFIFQLTILASVGAYILLGPLGGITTRLMFGDKVLPILPHLTIYGLAMVLFTINRTLSSYHMAKRQYSIGLVSLVGVVVMATGLVFFHSSLKDFTFVIVLAACVDTISIVAWRMWRRHGRFVFRILIDALDVLAPLPELVTPTNGKRILIFNWRDTKHAMAGGAEVYIHELAKRWVALGNQVTLFAGNDGKSKREEEVDGVLVIRRGGFWLVFFWGFVYYLFKFRSRYDLIIDGHNGIPFFTPFYAKEQTFCLLHHVHQHIFQKYLPMPLAKLACFMEAKLIPFTYRNIPFLTVSESSKQDMEKLGIGRAGITIINPGVSLSEFIPGKKALMPTILYLGRLKEYKSIPVLLEAFQKVKDEVVGPRLVIAGEGDEFERLRLLAKRLGLNGSVSFLGRVDEKSKIELMQQAWVFVNPSLMEGWGITSIEANACGTPVIASDVPGLRDSVKDPQSGFLVEHGEVEALADKIILLLNDEVVRHKMSEEARVWAGNFSWDILAEKCLARVNVGGGE